MRGCFGCLMYIFITFPVLIAAMLTVAILQWALDREFYADILTNDEIFTALYDDALPRYFTQEAFDREFEPDSAAAIALRDSIRVIAPEDFVRSELRQVVDEVFGFTSGERDVMMLSLNFVPIKENLRGAPGQQFAEALAQNVPDCAPGETSTFGDTEIPNCLPAGTSRAELTATISALIPSLAEEFPDRVELQDEPLRRDADWPDVPVNQIVGGGITAMIGFAGLVWFFNGLIGGGGARGLFGWLSVMLLIPALLMVLAGTATNAVVNADDWTFDPPMVDERGFSESVVLGEAVFNAFTLPFSRAADSLLQVGGVSALIAILLALLAASPLFKERQKDDVYFDPPPSGKVKVRPGGSSDSPIQGI